jgi:hypothetical protein
VCHHECEQTSKAQVQLTNTRIQRLVLLIGLNVQVSSCHDRTCQYDPALAIPQICTHKNPHTLPLQPKTSRIMATKNHRHLWPQSLWQRPRNNKGNHASKARDERKIFSTCTAHAQTGGRRDPFTVKNARSYEDRIRIKSHYTILSLLQLELTQGPGTQTTNVR